MKKLLFSMKKYGGDRIVLFSDDNLDQYIQMSEYIEKRRIKGLGHWPVIQTWCDLHCWNITGNLD